MMMMREPRYPYGLVPAQSTRLAARIAALESARRYDYAQSQYACSGGADSIAWLESAIASARGARRQWAVALGWASPESREWLVRVREAVVALAEAREQWALEPTGHWG